MGKRAQGARKAVCHGKIGKCASIVVRMHAHARASVCVCVCVRVPQLVPIMWQLFPDTFLIL